MTDRKSAKDLLLELSFEYFPDNETKVGRILDVFKEEIPVYRQLRLMADAASDRVIEKALNLVYTMKADKGWVVSHYDHTKKIYRNVLSHSGLIDLAYTKNLFQIMTPLMRDQEVKNFLKQINEKEFVISNDLKRKRAKVENEATHIEKLFVDLIKVAREKNVFVGNPSGQEYSKNNRDARTCAENLSRIRVRESTFHGGNTSESSIIVEIDELKYLIPPSCSFFNCDIREIEEKLNGSTFDFILLDPPWKNKFVRRKKSKDFLQGYKMLSDYEIQEIPICKFLKDNSLVGVWCTNAPSHIEAIKEIFFNQWGLVYCATWFWVKVTQYGTPVCPFISGHGKKPYERIIFGCSPGRQIRLPEENKLIISVPSSIHSHKPPLSDLLSGYLPDKPKCLELFARYLLPGWTSIGNQVLSLQCIQYFENNNVI